MIEQEIWPNKSHYCYLGERKKLAMKNAVERNVEGEGCVLQQAWWRAKMKRNIVKTWENLLSGDAGYNTLDKYEVAQQYYYIGYGGGVVFSIADTMNLNHVLFTSAAFGMVAANNAMIAGRQGGCQQSGELQHDGRCFCSQTNAAKRQRWKLELWPCSRLVGTINVKRL